MYNKLGKRKPDITYHRIPKSPTLNDRCDQRFSKCGKPHIAIFQSIENLCTNSRNCRMHRLTYETGVVSVTKIKGNTGRHTGYITQIHFCTRIRPRL